MNDFVKELGSQDEAIGYQELILAWMSVAIRLLLKGHAGQGFDSANSRLPNAARVARGATVILHLSPDTILPLNSSRACLWTPTLIPCLRVPERIWNSLTKVNV